jgi:energy-coupling factor transporter ATP-binding protein EcfA2
MTKKNNLNFNINKDDNVYNDFIYCWSEMGIRPSKTIIYKNYSSEFINFFDDKKIQETTVHEDIIPLDDENMVNQRFFVKLSDNIWFTYTAFDVESEESFIGEVSFYYDYKSHYDVRKIILELDQFEIKDEPGQIESKSNMSRISIGQTGIELEPISENIIDLENIEYYYNDETFKQISKLSKKIKKSNHGLSIIYGEKGTGKTSIVNFLSNKIKQKQFIYLPTNLFDNTINNPEFKNFLKKNKDSVIILDDAEIFFSETFYTKSNIFTTNLLQLVDGIDASELALNLILILNCDRESDIDSSLISSNNLIDVIRLDDLTKSKANELSKHLGKKLKSKQSTKLNDILKNKPTTFSETEIGFE